MRQRVLLVAVETDLRARLTCPLQSAGKLERQATRKLSGSSSGESADLHVPGRRVSVDPMQIISHHEVLSPAIPRTLARAIRRVAQRDGIPVATVVKRLLQDALAAEGEMPGPRGNDPVPIFTRIDTGALDGGC
jgi:hypothetical protein